jgi:hypothetical protein
MSVQTFTGHPLIKNTQEYMVYHKYVSIHSEDRDILKYPNSCQFEIEFPEDYLNVLSVRLVTWSFPSNYNTFSKENKNVEMTFKISVPYNPVINGNTDPLVNAIYQGLTANANNNYLVILPDGFYNPNQLTITLTTLFNLSVSGYLLEYLNEFYPSLAPQFESNGGYKQFVITYNVVTQKIWFGNRCDVFILTNSTQIVNNFGSNVGCVDPQTLPNTNYGLPLNLGLPLSNLTSESQSDLPNFYYDSTSPDGGNWVTPDPSLNGCQVSVLPAPDKINILGNSYIYMDAPEFNCIDETSPFNISNYTLHSNVTNGRVNSAFAKISVPVTPLSQWYDADRTAYKLYNPPAERIRKFAFKLRYHDGTLVNFGKFPYSFTLEFTMYVPQQSKKYNLYNPQIGRIS